MTLFRVLVVGLLGLALFAQEAKDAQKKQQNVTLEEVEALRVENARNKLAILSKDYQMAQQQIALAQQAMEKIQAEFEKSRGEQMKVESDLFTKYKVDNKKFVIDTSTKTFVEKPAEKQAQAQN